MKNILGDLQNLSLEKQLSISNNILKSVNKEIEENIQNALDTFSCLINDLGDLKGKTILLIQPEKYMTLGIFLCLNGASIVYGLNRFVKSEERLSNYYEKLLEFILKNKAKVIVRRELLDDEITKLYNDIVSIDKTKMRSYLNREKIQLSPNEDTSMMPYQDNMFDIVISRHAMETHYFPFQSIDEIRRVMAKNALLYMRISPNGKEDKTSKQLVSLLKHTSELHEKSFSYKSKDYCNRIQKSELIFHLNNFKLKVDSVKEISNIKINDFDKKDINIHFILCGEEDLSSRTFSIIAHKKENKNDNFTQEDYKSYSKAVDLHQKGKYSAACARFESMTEHLTDDRINHGLFHSLYFLKDYERVYSTFKQIKKTHFKQTVKNYYYVADSLYNLEKYDEAKKYFLAAEKIAPRQYHVINAIGLCEYKTGNIAQGLKRMKKAVNIYPYYSEGLSNIGMILEKIDKKKAIEHFKMVLTFNPGNHQGIQSMGRLLYEQGRFEEASKYLKDYCLVDGSHETSLKMYIDCLIKLGLKRTAKKELEGMLKKDPTNRYISHIFEDYIANVSM
jgi:tetratricopeptide (TPR) repeat protein